MTKFLLSAFELLELVFHVGITSQQRIIKFYLSFEPLLFYAALFTDSLVIAFSMYYSNKFTKKEGRNKYWQVMWLKR